VTKASPSPHPTASWPIVVGILAAVTMVAAVLSASVRGGQFGLEGDAGLISLLGGSALSVGAVILWRRPDHGVGWVCLAAGSLLVAGYVVHEVIYAGWFDLPSPLVALLALGSQAAPMCALTLLGPVLVGVFPDGRFGSVGGRVAAAYLAVVVPVVVVSSMTSARVELDGLFLENPLAVRGLRWPLPVGADVILIGAYVSSLLLAATGLAARYRRADVIGRLQIRWVGANLIALIVTVALVFAFPDTLGESLWWLMILFAGLTPVTVAIAVTRYRLYEIDRIVGKTVTYGLVTLLLFATFLVANLSLQRLLVSLTGVGSPLAVAASTLLVAALFSPIRGRVQAVVDRRFHRARYDADRLVAGFAGRLRDEMDLGALHREIVATVDGSVEPSGVNLWLRERA
jgi:hypothetical protein